VQLLCLLLVALPTTPYVRWIDEKGDVHVEILSEVLEESPSETRVRLVDGSERTVRMARVIDMVRENADRKEERALLDARRDVAAGIRPDASRETLDRLARDGSEPWIREYAAAARAILAERTREKDAGERVERFLEEYPHSRFQSDTVVARARLLARSRRMDVRKAIADLHAGYDRIAELEGPLALRFRILQDGSELILRYQPEGLHDVFLDPTEGWLLHETGDGKDYGAFLLVGAAAKWAQLLEQQWCAARDAEHKREPRGALEEVKKLRDRAGLDLPEVRSDIERELGSLMLLCGDKEGARGAWEHARDLAPDPRRREAAEEALRKLAP